VVGLKHAEHVAPAAVGPRQTDRQIIGLAAAVDQKHPVHAFRRQFQQALGKLGDRCVVESRVGIEQRPLTRRDRRHARMAVTEHRDVVEHVQIGAALHVDQVIAPAALDTRRIDVIVFLRAGETGVAPMQQGFAHPAPARHRRPAPATRRAMDTVPAMPAPAKACKTMAHADAGHGTTAHATGH
jgi:hypothetical protein